jgi:hypothetical protein
MTDVPRAADRSRREFIRDIAACATAAITAARPGDVMGEVQMTEWRHKIGLELYTVRDQLALDYEGTLAKVASMGYREIEPANGYNNMSPPAFRSMLDRLRLTMPSRHSGASGTGAELERQLEGFQIMGIKYTELAAGGAAAARAGSAVAAQVVLCPLARTSTPVRASSTTHSRRPKCSDRTSRRRPSNR